MKQTKNIWVRFVRKTIWGLTGLWVLGWGFIGVISIIQKESPEVYLIIIPMIAIGCGILCSLGWLLTGRNIFRT